MRTRSLSSTPTRRAPAGWGVRRHGVPQKWSARSAAAIVEFAIVANLVFLLTFTCIEFARVNMIRNLMQDAAYYSARHAMVPGATQEEAIAEAQRVMGIGGVDSAEVQITVNGESLLDNQSTRVDVTVSLDVRDVALFTPMFFSEKSLEATASMRTERYNGFFQN
ncbi:MAG: TadE family protein [Planctomycetota bacterium]